MAEGDASEGGILRVGGGGGGVLSGRIFGKTRKKKMSTGGVTRKHRDFF